MSDPISQSSDQVIEKFLLLDPGKRAQVALAIYPLAPELASELHNLAMLFQLEISGREAPLAQPPKAAKQTDPLLRSHRSTSQL